MTNYKQILLDLAGMAYYHPQINSFGYGDIKQITMDIETKKSPVYTKMYVLPGTTTLEQNQIRYSFSIIILDRINDDYSNQPDVMSDTLEIAKDIFTIIYQSYNSYDGNFTLYYEPEWGPNVTPFLERFEDILGGWTLNIDIIEPFDYNYCEDPMNDGWRTGYPWINGSAPIGNVYEYGYNYKLVVENLKKLADNHKQINSFGFGDITQITMDVETEKEPYYTKMYVVPGDTVLNQNQLNLSFQIIVLDQVNNDLSNQRDVMSDTLEICKDIFTQLYLSQYISEWNSTCDPFLERFETILGGWTLNIQLTIPHDYNRCDLPELPFDHYKWYQLAELWSTVDTDWKNI